MSAAPRRDALARVRALCLALPEAEERPFGDHTAPAFRIRDKFFAMTSEDGSSMTLKAPKGVQAVLVASDPARFFVPKYVGHIGWVGRPPRPVPTARLGRAGRDDRRELLPHRAQAPGCNGRPAGAGDWVGQRAGESEVRVVSMVSL